MRGNVKNRSVQVTHWVPAPVLQSPMSLPASPIESKIAKHRPVNRRRSGRRMVQDNLPTEIPQIESGIVVEAMVGAVRREVAFFTEEEWDEGRRRFEKYKNGEFEQISRRRM